MKPAQFALVTAISIGPIHHEANRFALRPGQTIRGAQIGNRMLKSDSGRMYRPHKAMPGYHSVVYPTENRRTKPFPLHPSTARTPKTNPQHGPNRKSATEPGISPWNGHGMRYQRKATNSPATPKPRNSNNPRTRRQTTTTDNPPDIPRPADQNGNQSPNSESVHETPPDEGLRLVRHHRPYTPNRGIPMISAGYHRRTQPGCGKHWT